MPLDVVHDNEGQPTTHREIHNVYGLLNTRSTYEGLQRLRPDQRPFILTRATFAGGQRYSAIWPGRQRVATGRPCATPSPCSRTWACPASRSWARTSAASRTRPSPELFTRWLQMGVFYPFMRVHTTFGTPDQEPWSYGLRHEELNRRAIELRYELLPHIYNVMEEAHRTGIPPFRPLLLEYPEDGSVYGREDEFLFGADLLVAPVLREGVTQREVYLPAGEWFDFWTGRRHAGGKSIDRSRRAGLDPDLRARPARWSSASPSSSTRARCRGSRWWSASTATAGPGSSTRTTARPSGTRGARSCGGGTNGRGPAPRAGSPSPPRRARIVRPPGTSCSRCAGRRLPPASPRADRIWPRWRPTPGPGRDGRVDDAGVLRVRVPDRFDALTVEVASS